MNEKSFSINVKDMGISVHRDNMNPSEVMDLIKTLQGNLYVIMRQKSDPIDVLKKSIRLNRASGEVSFRLSWSSNELTANILDKSIPEPNVTLSELQRKEYFDNLTLMMDSV